MYRAIELSKHIVTKCVADGCAISNLQLQKILYYIQKDFLQRDCVAFFDDIEAWQFGPVVPAAYYEFCGFGVMPITNIYKTNGIKPLDLKRINYVVDAKKFLEPWDLVADVHKENGAWSRIWQNGLGSRKVIPLDFIAKY